MVPNISRKVREKCAELAKPAAWAASVRDLPSPDGADRCPHPVPEPVAPQRHAGLGLERDAGSATATGRTRRRAANRQPVRRAPVHPAHAALRRYASFVSARPPIPSCPASACAAIAAPPDASLSASPVRISIDGRPLPARSKAARGVIVAIARDQRRARSLPSGSTIEKRHPAAMRSADGAGCSGGISTLRAARSCVVAGRRIVGDIERAIEARSARTAVAFRCGVSPNAGPRYSTRGAPPDQFRCRHCAP